MSYRKNNITNRFFGLKTTTFVTPVQAHMPRFKKVRFVEIFPCQIGRGQPNSFPGCLIAKITSSIDFLGHNFWYPTCPYYGNVLFWKFFPRSEMGVVIWPLMTSKFELWKCLGFVYMPLFTKRNSLQLKMYTSIVRAKFVVNSGRW